MVDLFNTILEMSIKGGIVIIAVILLRALLYKAPKRYSYLLWIAAGFRLCCPISFRAFFSIFTFTNPKAPTLPNTSGDIIVGIDEFGKYGVSAGSDEFISGGKATAEFLERIDWVNIFNTIVMIIWFIGMAIALSYTFLSYFKLKRRMNNAVRLSGNVYMSELVSSPFTLGFIRPKIYIPYGLDNNTLEQILTHERCHIKRLDHIVKPLAFLILTVHWFNPLCWLGFRLMSLDMEMSCDEKVLKIRGDEVMKKNYTRALLSFATNKRFPAPSPIAFSESSGNAKKRIKHALYWKKPKFIVNLLCIVLCIATLVACGADAENAKWKEVKTETFGENPYNFVFGSNGDGTCYVKEIRIDKDHSGDIHLIIPEKAPNGDTVVEIQNVWGLNSSDSIQNVPIYLDFDSMNEIVSKIENTVIEATTENLENGGIVNGVIVGQNRERDAKIFKAFYREKISENGLGYYELEPYISFEESKRLETILDAYDYGEEDCYNDTVKFLDGISVSEEDKNLLAREAFKFRYHVGESITEITLPSTVKMICFGAFDGCDNLEKVNGISDDCMLGVIKNVDPSRPNSSESTKIVINGTPKKELYSYENNPDGDPNADFINALN